MEEKGWTWLGPKSPDPEMVRHGAKLRTLDKQRRHLRRSFNRKGADSVGRQIVAARRKLLNAIG